VELRHLRAFLEVATHRHFHHAAAALHLTQPTLTQRIHALEGELGVPLLTRNSREVRLTMAGEMLLPYARSLVQIEDRALGELRDLRSGITGRLRIGYLANADLVAPARIVAEFRRRNPTVRVETSDGGSKANIERVLGGGLDIGFAVLLRQPPEELGMKAIGRDHLMLAMHYEHPLAGLDTVPVSALRGQPLLLPAPWDSLRRFLSRGTGEEPRVVAQEPPDQAVETILNDRSLMTLVSGLRAARVPIPGIAYRRLTPSPLFDVGVAYRRGDPSPVLAGFLGVVDEVAPFQPGEVPTDADILNPQLPAD
jgi:DNA-binding transcriptional LysR family regulator